jgi:fatty-acyl-CoA synthase
MFSRHFTHWPRALPRRLSLPQTSLYFNLQVSAARHPRHTALHYYGRDLTYAELDRQVCALAGWLQQRCGVRKGDRVLLYLPNSPQFVIGYYAILRADAVVVPVNPMNRSEELRHYVEDAGAATVISLQELWPEIAPLMGGTDAPQGALAHCVLGACADYIDPATDLPLPETVRAPRRTVAHAGLALWCEVLSADCEPGPHTAGFDDLCVMPYTSGTTGKPKGCMHTHGTVLATSTGGMVWRSVTPETVAMGVLPMFHVTGMQAGMNTPIQSGSTVVVMTRWDRDCAARLIERCGVTTFTAITTMMVDFLSNPGLGNHDLSSLVFLGGGGAAMPEALAQKLKEVLGLEFVEGYGLSETMAPTHVNPAHRPKQQCGGIPFFGTDARVLNHDTGLECGVGEVGEIVVRGPQVFKGYWNNPRATAEAFMPWDGETFFRTGDLGYYDEDGYFFITDRLKRMINAAGFKVWPAEVEAMLYAHPDIQEACVIGSRDAYRGETVKAVIVLKPAAQDRLVPDDIIAWARGRMAAYKVPRVVEFVQALPRTGTGKVFWRGLQEAENARLAKSAA